MAGSQFAFTDGYFTACTAGNWLTVGTNDRYIFREEVLSIIFNFQRNTILDLT
jgi:hypothetical protein